MTHPARISKRTLLSAALSGVLTLAACTSGNGGTSTPAGSDGGLNGEIIVSGSSTVEPITSIVLEDFAAANPSRGGRGTPRPGHPQPRPQRGEVQPSRRRGPARVGAAPRPCALHRRRRWDRRSRGTPRADLRALLQGRSSEGPRSSRRAGTRDARRQLGAGTGHRASHRRGTSWRGGPRERGWLRVHLLDRGPGRWLGGLRSVVSPGRTRAAARASLWLSPCPRTYRYDRCPPLPPPRRTSRR